MRRLLAVAVLLPLLAACGSDQDDYCAAVQEHQQELSDIVGSGAPDALLKALDAFRDLQDQAPDDITDEWQQVVGRIEALAEALDAAGVDPATYDRDHPPEGVTAEQKARIDAAAAQLGSGTTLRALQDLDQQARDVCRTPLTL
ncbi:hypothetical protein [Nocardioides sp.]|uniref:hypothetical protein n=1 Tax=Nocardioides sp. TaxID=35761 RepID=UPI00260F3281|nr:hypothetical protein [Nocardioides sp.]MDI6911998.1 hypothetical protein [Nocardioides sp.]